MVNQDFSKDLQDINTKVNALIVSLKGTIDELTNKSIDIPSYDKVNKESLYSKYREAIIDNNEIADLLTKIGKVIIAIKELRASLGASKKIPDTLKKPIKDQLDGYLDSLYAYKESLQEQKDKYDKVLRFFQGAQYILASPRLYGYE